MYEWKYESLSLNPDYKISLSVPDLTLFYCSDQTRPQRRGQAAREADLRDRPVQAAGRAPRPAGRRDHVPHHRRLGAVHGRGGGQRLMLPLPLNNYQ